MFRKTVCPLSRGGSSSCDEDRLGHSEQPSKAQCRASHLGSADIRSYGVLLDAAVFEEPSQAIPAACESLTVGQV
jgi:hypothetical protein